MTDTDQNSIRLSPSQSAFLEQELRKIQEGKLEGGSSRTLRLVEYVLHERSKEHILLIHDELQKAGMLLDLRDINRTLVLKLMLIHLTNFQNLEGRLPEFRDGSSEEEFLLASWLHFQLNGPGIFQKESKWDKEQASET